MPSRRIARRRTSSIAVCLGSIFPPSPGNASSDGDAATAGRQSVVLEPTTQRLVDSVASGPPLYTLTPQTARDVLTRVQRMPVAKLPASIQDTLLPVGPTGETRVRIVRP